MATTLRHRDAVIDPVLKARYLFWLGRQLTEDPPTEQDELNDKVSADRFYSRCTVVLRDRTRDTERFKLVFEENVTYGFRRNLLGLKHPTLVLDCLIGLICIYVFWRGLDMTGNATKPAAVLMAFGVTCLHSLYFAFVVTKASVLEAADQYGRQLVLSIETLMS